APRIGLNATPKLREICRKLSENPDFLDAARRRIDEHLLRENPYSNKEHLKRLRDAIIQAVLET
nr:hypothetical protein [Candidatus Sigynarchaeota archaeon]